MAEDKIIIDDINREFYDFRYEESEKDFYRIEAGLNPDIVKKLSEEKGDPEWMKEFRLKSLEQYNKMGVSTDWMPNIDGLHMEDIATYVRPKTEMSGKWEDVPEDIKDTFEKLGIPEAERKSLAGVGAQYDSELVYHNIQDEVAKQGVVYLGLKKPLKVKNGDQW